MSLSVSLSQKERRLGLCLLPPLVNLDFGCSCGLCRYLTLVSFLLLLLSLHLLLPRPRLLPLPVRFLLVKEVLFWETLLLPLLELPALLARPEVFEITDFTDLWLIREVDFTLGSRIGSP